MDWSTLRVQILHHSRSSPGGHISIMSADNILFIWEKSIRNFHLSKPITKEYGKSVWKFIVSSAKILFRGLDVDCILNSEKCSMYQLSLFLMENDTHLFSQRTKTNPLIRNVKNYTRFETFV